MEAILSEDDIKEHLEALLSQFEQDDHDRIYGLWIELIKSSGKAIYLRDVEITHDGVSVNHRTVSVSPWCK